MNWLGTEACRLLQDPVSEVKQAGGDHDDVLFALGRRHVAVLIREMQLPRVLEQAKRHTVARHTDSPIPTKPSLSQRRAARGKT